ncbi:MAG: heme exporter protein CcmD [Gammaproteobacteria bacterium]|nr:heme exporter protein CcmD [Gammaproteobacteria bacterium]
MTLTEFFNMGGYAIYVWPAFGLTAVVLILNIVLPQANFRRALREQLTRNHRENES